MQHLINQVHNLDALDFLTLLEPQSVDAIITDLPYGTTACTWDTIIPFAPMWAAVKRVLKPRGVFVTTASQPFTSALVMSNLAWFKYEWIWRKNRSTQMMNARYRPLMEHENILVFSPTRMRSNQFIDEKMTYNPQGVTSIFERANGKSEVSASNNLRGNVNKVYIKTLTNFPKTVLRFDVEVGLHPTQKPVALYEYLISTYTLPGELVVDPCCGSGTTGVAARNLKRDYILNDKELEYVEITRDRLRGAWDKPRQKESDLSGLPLFDGMIDEENHS